MWQQNASSRGAMPINNWTGLQPAKQKYTISKLKTTEGVAIHSEQTDKTLKTSQPIPRKQACQSGRRWMENDQQGRQEMQV